MSNFDFRCFSIGSGLTYGSIPNLHLTYPSANCKLFLWMCLWPCKKCFVACLDCPSGEVEQRDKSEGDRNDGCQLGRSFQERHHARVHVQDGVQGHSPSTGRRRGLGHGELYCLCSVDAKLWQLPVTVRVRFLAHYVLLLRSCSREGSTNDPVVKTRKTPCKMSIS